MSDDEPQQTEWEDEVGLSEETTCVAIYPSRKYAEEWIEKAEEQGYEARACPSGGVPCVQSERVEGGRGSTASQAARG